MCNKINIKIKKVKMTMSVIYLVTKIGRAEGKIWHLFKSKVSSKIKTQ